MKAKSRNKLTELWQGLSLAVDYLHSLSVVEKPAVHTITGPVGSEPAALARGAVCYVCDQADFDSMSEK